MNSRFIIIAILIFIKVIGIASHAKADFFCNNYVKGFGNSDYPYGYGYDSDGLNVFGQKSILKFAEDSYCNERRIKRINDFIKSKEIF